MSTEIQEMPEQGEIVLATVSKVMDHGAYVTLDEYDDIQGFLHISEIAPGWIRSISRFVRDGEKKVLLVKKVNSKRGDIDLSLKQISKDQKKQKLKEVKKFEKGKTLLQNVQEKAKLSDCLEGKTDFGEIGYGGPAPPDKEHTYIFKLYALDQKLDVDKGSTKKQIEEIMKNHIIAETRLEGKYSP